jgi:hypothetical protein
MTVLSYQLSNRRTAKHAMIGHEQRFDHIRVVRHTELEISEGGIEREIIGLLFEGISDSILAIARKVQFVWRRLEESIYIPVGGLFC